MAGRYHWRAPRKEPGLHFQENEILLPQVLKDAGYNTAAFGKWHLGWGDGRPLDEKFWNGEIKPGPNDTGFDYYFGVPQSHAQPPFVFVENTRVYKLDPADPIILTTNQPSHWKYTGNSGGSIGAKAAHEACDYTRLDLTLAERASAYIAKQTKDKPFFVYLPFYAPHVPLLPSKEFRGSSQAGELGDFIQQMDAAVGMVLKALEAHGFATNTLVIFTSDNGGCYIKESTDLGHRSMGTILGLKGDAWEGGHRVPFMARWPGRIPASTDCDKLLSLTDLFATFVAAANIALPKNAAPDSLNQLPLLAHPVGTPAIRTEMMYFGKGTGALRSDDWVYLPLPGSMGLFGTDFYMPQLGYKNSDFDDQGHLRPDHQPAQLYNLRDDPAQTTNLYGKYPEIVAQMDARLKEIMRQRKSR
jgi:arylsulfatase A-like enzyme